MSDEAAAAAISAPAGRARRARLAAVRRMAAAAFARRRRAAVGHRRRLRVLRRGPRVPAAAAGRRALVQQPRGPVAMAVLGPVVAVRHPVDVRRRARVVRPLLSRRHVTEAASRHGLGRAVPRWMKWGGWPFVAFALTTVFGQLVSVYSIRRPRCSCSAARPSPRSASARLRPRQARLVPALCPVNGVFAVLSRVAPVHFRVDAAAWTRERPRIPVHPVNCAPLVRIRRMTARPNATCAGVAAASMARSRSPRARRTARSSRCAEPRADGTRR